jgi:Tol biopolymer transport system component
MDADDGGQRRLTTDARYDVAPVFSPDGLHILFASCPGTGPGCDLVTVDRDGRGRRRLLVAPAR